VGQPVAHCFQGIGDRRGIWNLAGFKGPTSKRREGRGRKGGKGKRERRGWRGGEEM